MIKAIHIQSFKAIRRAQIDLERLTVFVGPNASGKTSVLEGLFYLGQLGKSPPWVVFKDQAAPSELMTRGSGVPLLLELLGTWGSTPGGVRIIFEPSEESADAPFTPCRIQESWSLQHRQRLWESLLKRREQGQQNSVLLPGLAQAISSVAMLQLNPKRLRKPCSTKGPSNRLGQDGSDLASVLAEIAATDPMSFAELQEGLRAVVPSVQQVRLERTYIPGAQYEQVRVQGEDYYRKVEWTASGYRIVFDMVGAPSISADAASEGTMLTLCVLAAIMAPGKPKLILMDDIEHALHPKAVGDLVGQLRKILDRYPELQIIATSHSPYLVDHLDPSEVRLSALDPDGTAVFAKLTDHPEFDR